MVRNRLRHRRQGLPLGGSLRRTTIAAVLAGGMGLLGWSATAAAFSFGSLQVQSSLNEPLRASLWLDGVQAPADTLTVQMASPSRFEDLGVHWSSLADRIQIQSQAEDSRHRVHVVLTTDKPVTQPIVSFVLRAETSAGTSLHVYTALLNPPGSGAGAADQGAGNGQTASASVAGSAASGGGPAGQGPILPPIPHHRQTATARQPIAASSTYRVRPGDTLWEIAGRAAPTGVSIDRTALAIYQANASAFDGGPAHLKAGAALDIPSTTGMREVSTSAAAARFGPSNTTTSAEIADRQTPSRVASPDNRSASGELPPSPSDFSSNSPARQSITGSSRSSAQSSASAQVAAADSSPAFGTLLPPSDASWQSGGVTTGRPATASAADSGGATVPSGASPPVAATASSASATSPDTAGSSTSSSHATSGPSVTAAAGSTPNTSTTPTTISPNSGRSGGGFGSLFGTRNLILLLGLLLVVFGYLRVRQRRKEEERTAAAVSNRPRPAGKRTQASGATAATAQSADAVPPAPTDRAETAPTTEPAWLGAPLPTRPRASDDESRPRPAAPDEIDRPKAKPTSGGPAIDRDGYRDAPSSSVVARATDGAAERPLAEDSTAATASGHDEFVEPSARESDRSEDPVEDEPDRTLPAESVGTPRDHANATGGAVDMPERPVSGDDLAFETSTIEARSRVHDAGIDTQGLDFDAAPESTGPSEKRDAEERAPRVADLHQPTTPTPEERSMNAAPPPESTPPADVSDDSPIGKMSRYDLEMIDPGDFDLYDAGSKQADHSDDTDEDSLQIRLDLARMYVDMDDMGSARSLARDVQSRGTEAQRAAAERLLAEIDPD